MAQQVKLPQGQSGAAFSMVGQHCFGSQPQLTTDASLKDAVCRLKDAGRPWTTVSGYANVLRALAQSSRHADKLLGADEETKTQVTEWLEFRDSEGAAMNDAKLQKLNEHLLTRNYLVGGDLTLADFAIFAAAHSVVSALSQEQVQQHVNLVRWFDFIQHTADTTDTHAKVAVKKPSLCVPRPPAPAAKDKAAAKGKDSGDKKAAAAAPSGAPAAATAATTTASPEQTAQAPADAAPPAAADAAGDEKKGKKEKKEKKAKAAPAPAVKAPASITALDIRVGEVVDVQNHPDAEKLYIEKIDLGEESGPRTIVSGLRLFVPLEQMQGRRVVVLANLKPAKLVGIASAGMVLCASNGDHTAVDPISPPESAAIGERITFRGHEGEPEAQLNPKKKVFEELAPSLKTDGSGVAKYQDIAFSTSAGVVTSTIPNASVR